MSAPAATTAGTLPPAATPARKTAWPLGTVLTLAWALPSLAYFLYWAANRSYFFLNPAIGTKEAAAEYARLFMPANMPAEMIQQFGGAISAFYDGNRYFPIRVHVLVSALMGVIMAFNLVVGTSFRSNRVAFYLHRKLGWVFVALWAVFMVEMAFTLFYRGMLPLSPAFVYNNSASWVVLGICVPLGLYYARHHRKWAHRRCMVLATAALAVNPMQRLWWEVLGRNGYGAPYAHIGEFIATAGVHSEYLASVLCWGLGLLYAFWPRASAGYGKRPAGVKTE